MLEIFRETNAQADTLEIWLHIAKDNIAAADQLADTIDAALVMLAANPFSGRSRPDLAEDIRSFPVANVTIFYTVTSSQLRVVRILSGHRDSKRHFTSR